MCIFSESEKMYIDSINSSIKDSLSSQVWFQCLDEQLSGPNLEKYLESCNVFERLIWFLVHTQKAISQQQPSQFYLGVIEKPTMNGLIDFQIWIQAASSFLERTSNFAGICDAINIDRVFEILYNERGSEFPSTECQSTA